MPACRTLCLRLEPTQIHFFRFVLEGYEGLAVVTTLDPASGLVRLSVAAGGEADMARVLEALGPELHIELRPEVARGRLPRGLERINP
jgi:hypothetical protein